LPESNKYITFEMVKYSELFRALRRDGWYIVRQKGSHVMMKHPVKKNKIFILYHAGRDIGTGILRKIIKEAGIKFNKR